MADLQLRRRERRASSGEADAQAQALRDAMRAQRVDRPRVLFAAALGDPASTQILAEEAPARVPHEDWIAHLRGEPGGDPSEAWTRPMLVRAAHVASELVHETSPVPGDLERVCAYRPGLDTVLVQATQLGVTTADVALAGGELEICLRTKPKHTRLVTRPTEHHERGPLYGYDDGDLTRFRRSAFYEEYFPGSRYLARLKVSQPKGRSPRGVRLQLSPDRKLARQRAAQAQRLRELVSLWLTCPCRDHEQSLEEVTREVEDSLDYVSRSHMHLDAQRQLDAVTLAAYAAAKAVVCPIASASSQAWTAVKSALTWGGQRASQEIAGKLVVWVLGAGDPVGPGDALGTLGLPPKVEAVLTGAGIETLGDLTAWTPKRLCALKGIGAKAAGKIGRSLEDRANLSLGEEAAWQAGDVYRPVQVPSPLHELLGLA